MNSGRSGRRLAACAQLLSPLYDLLCTEVLCLQVIHTDDTPVKLQDPTTHQLSTSRLWVHLGDAAHPYNVFDFADRVPPRFQLLSAFAWCNDVAVLAIRPGED